jgi:hypothetical protein
VPKRSQYHVATAAVRALALAGIVLSAPSLLGVPTSRGNYGGDLMQSSTAGQTVVIQFGDALPYWAQSRFDSARFLNDLSTEHYVLKRDPKDRHLFAFFPPDPPLLDSEFAILAGFESGPEADPDLAPFVREIFYPYLGVRLAYGELIRGARAEVLAYRNAKLVLQNGLRAKLIALKDTDPAQREAQLAALDRQQGARIDELERRAQAIRTDLKQLRIVNVPIEYTDLDERPEWRSHAGEEPSDDLAAVKVEADSVRGIAFYEDGFSLDQRLLLVEESCELDLRAAGSSSRPAVGTRTVFFSPFGSRISLPLELPDALEKELAAYLAEKEGLKAAIRTTLRETQDSIAGSRIDAVRHLAELQAPAFADLDERAERIRRALAALPNQPGPPKAPALPEELAARIAAYRAHKVETLHKLRSMIGSPTPVADAHPGSPPNAAVNALAWMHDGTSRTEIQPTDLRVSVGEFDRMQAEMISSLNKEENSIREGLADFERSTNAPADRKSINDLLREFEAARQQQEIWDKFRDYHTAVLTPGLTPRQRRLLFDAGVEQLDLPLPAGESLPLVQQAR